MDRNRDRIQVKFTRFGGEVKGNIQRDVADRRKIVFINEYDITRPAAFKGKLPRHNEEWICEVVGETNPRNPFAGVLRVSLVAPLKLELTTKCGGRLVVLRDTLQRLRSQPEVINLLGKVAARITFPHDDLSIEAEIDMGRNIGERRIVEVPRVEIDQPCYFAQRIGHRRPSRIAKGMRGERTSIVSVRAEPFPSFASYHLRTAAFGELTPREPWAVEDEEELEEESFPFWSRHAFVYDPRTMIGEPVRSSWDEIMNRSDVLQSRPVARAPQYAVAHADAAM